jgi:hypothetical protein
MCTSAAQHFCNSVGGTIKKAVMVVREEREVRPYTNSSVQADWPSSRALGWTSSGKVTLPEVTRRSTHSHSAPSFKRHKRREVWPAYVQERLAGEKEGPVVER